MTVVFLNAILQKTGRNKIKDVVFTNSEINREYAEDKLSRLDLLVVTDAEERINVEIQLANQYDMIKRSIYYGAKLFTEALGKGVSYDELRPVIAINILNFDMFDQTEQFHTSYHLYEDEEQFALTNVMEFHFIEMEKLMRNWQADKLDPWNSILARWLLMLGMVDSKHNKVYDGIYHELEEIAMKDESLKETFEHWEKLSMSIEERAAYEGRLKQFLDEQSARRNMELREQRLQEAEQKAKENGMEEGRQKGMEEGIQKGREEGMQKGREEGMQKGMEEGKQVGIRMMVRELLARGTDRLIVADLTGLTEDEIKAIQRDM